MDRTRVRGRRVEQLEFVVGAWLFSERRVPVPILLDASPADSALVFGRVVEAAEGFSPGYFLVGPHDVQRDANGWRGETLLEPVPGRRRVASVRLDPPSKLHRLGGIVIASTPAWPRRADPPESERGVNPFGTWALDEKGRAFVVFDRGDELWAPSPYGASLHPGRYRVLDRTQVGATTTARVRSVVATDDEPAQQWRLGTRRAIEEAAPDSLPPVVVPDWIVALRPSDGGAPFPVMLGREDGVVTLRRASDEPRDWPEDARIQVEGARTPEAAELAGTIVTLRAIPYRALTPTSRPGPDAGHVLGSYLVEQIAPGTSPGR